MPRARIEPRSICIVGIENLLVLAPEYRTHGIGGAQLQQTLLAAALVRRGFSVSMVVADHGQAEGAEWLGIRTHKAYAFAAGLPGVRFIHPRATSVWAAMRRANAQVYYSSCADYLPGVLALFAKLHGRKTVFRIAHDTDCQPDRIMIPNWRSKKLYLYGLPRTDLILAQTTGQQADMQSNFHLPSRVIPSLVALPDYDPDPAARDIDVLWVSNIRPFKRPNLALDLAAAMPEVKFHMVGGTQPGALDYYEEIRQRANTLPNVEFYGALPYEQVEKMLARARLFINTSESEGFPNTYMQGWARGTPVVATFDPDGVVARNGLGRAVSSVDQMRAAVAELLGDRTLWSQVSTHCREYVSETHGEKAVAAYAEALGTLAQTVKTA